MAMVFSGKSPTRSQSLLLPGLLATVLALALVNEVCMNLGLTFLVPSSGPARQMQLPQHQQLAGQFQPFAGMAAARPTAKVPDLKRAPFEAPVPLMIAATAMAAGTAAAASAVEEKSTESALVKAFNLVKLPIFVGLWYLFNIQYNIQNKQLLSCFGATWAVSFMQLAAGIPIAGLMWLTGFVRKPRVSNADIIKLAPVGMAFALGQVATVASLGAVAVSFTHVVKALEPAVNAIASALVLGQVFHPLVYASLLPVFLGVALASSAELSFTMFGFLTAMASNFAFVARNVLATKFGSTGDMGEDKTTRKTNQLAVLTIVATLVLLPVALVLPGGLLSIPSAWSAAVKSGVPASRLAFLIGASGFNFFMYQLSSFWVLSCVQPITHSVLNTMKRVVIIVASVFVFRNPVTVQGAAGTAIAIGGVLLYSLTKKHFSTKK